MALATSLLAALSMMWALLLPAFRSVDEAPYTSTAIRLAVGGGYPAPGTVLLDEGVRASYDALGHAAPGSGRPSGPLPPRSSEALPSWADLRAEGWRLDPLFDHDQVSQHPPLWAVWLAAVARGLDLDEAPADVALLWLRLASALPLLLLPLLIVRTALTIGLTRPAVWVAAVVPAGWPRLVELCAGVSNTAMAIVSCTVVVWLAMRTSRGWVGVGPGLATGLALGLALLIKGLAFATFPVVVLALLLAARHCPPRRLLAHALAVVVASLTGLWWWVRNIVLFGNLQPTGFTEQQNAALNDAGREVRAVVVDLPLGISRDLWTQPMGSPPLSDLIHLAITAAAVALAVVVLATTRGGPSDVRVRLALCLLPGPTVVIMTALGALSGAPGVGISVTAHARYVIIVAGGVALVAGAAANLAPRWTWVAPVFLLSVGLAALVIEQTNLWAGESLVERAHAMSTWWSLPDVVPWLCAVLAATSAALLGLLLRREVSHGTQNRTTGGSALRTYHLG